MLNSFLASFLLFYSLYIKSSTYIYTQAKRQRIGKEKGHKSEIYMFFSQGLSFLPGSVQRLLGKNIY